MITERINNRAECSAAPARWDYEDEMLAWSIHEKFKMQGKVVWVKGTVVYWIDESTD